MSGRSAWMKTELGPERPPRHIGSPAPATSSRGGSSPSTLRRLGSVQRSSARMSWRRSFCRNGPATATLAPAIFSRSTPSRPSAIHAVGRSKWRCSFSTTIGAVVRALVGHGHRPALGHAQPQRRARVGALLGPHARRREQVAAAEDRPLLRDARVVGRGVAQMVDAEVVAERAADARRLPGRAPALDHELAVAAQVLCDAPGRCGRPCG